MRLRSDFERDGVAVVRGFVSEGEVAAMHATFLSLVPEIAYPASPDGTILRELTGLCRTCEPLAELARESRFGALAAEALGAERVQLLQDSLLYKPPLDGGAVHWHQDHRYVGYLVPARVIALRIALLPEDDDNGCMRVVDGSHRWGPIGAVRALSEGSVVSLAAELSAERRADLEHARSLTLDAGDVSIHHCLTLHCSGANRGTRPRRTIILRMFDATCRLDRARLPPGSEIYFPTTGDGQLDESAFPRVH